MLGLAAGSQPLRHCDHVAERNTNSAKCFQVCNRPSLQNPHLGVQGPATPSSSSCVCRWQLGS